MVVAVVHPVLQAAALVLLYSEQSAPLIANTIYPSNLTNTANTSITSADLCC